MTVACMSTSDAIMLSDTRMFVAENENGQKVISMKWLCEKAGYKNCEETTFGKCCTIFGLEKTDEAYRKGKTTIE